MAKRKVLVYPDARLREKAIPIATINEEIQVLAQDMLETMYDEDGIGLAATQIGVAYRMLTVDLSEHKNEPQVWINPVITERHGTVDSHEGCLSFPGIAIDIQRAERVRIEGLDLAGKPFQLEATGLMARCLQHEMDHLEGIVFTDHLSPLKRRRALAQVLSHVKLEKAKG